MDYIHEDDLKIVASLSDGVLDTFRKVPAVEPLAYALNRLISEIDDLERRITQLEDRNA